ncbi:MAG: hypothetical protein DRN33_03120 [Thermoplasmata archaeon]|nr:MAG: hypothetical protein FE043_00495 [Thermoplasmata archaeon]RLF63952.1 MAG: hypothetical protein DRN33_03120 [Thermoplasmata archaeon]
MSGVESNCGYVSCPKYGDKVDLKTCMLCPHYKKLVFGSRCCWKIDNLAHSLVLHYRVPAAEAAGEK